MRTNSANVKSTGVAPARAAALSPAAVSCFKKAVAVGAGPICISIISAIAMSAIRDGNLSGHRWPQNGWLKLRARNAASFTSVVAPPIRPMGS